MKSFLTKFALVLADERGHRVQRLRRQSHRHDPQRHQQQARRGPRRNPHPTARRHAAANHGEIGRARALHDRPPRNRLRPNASARSLQRRELSPTAHARHVHGQHRNFRGNRRSIRRFRHATRCSRAAVRLEPTRRRRILGRESNPAAGGVFQSRRHFQFHAFPMARN